MNRIWKSRWVLGLTLMLIAQLTACYSSEMLEGDFDLSDGDLDALEWEDDELAEAADSPDSQASEEAAETETATEEEQPEAEIEAENDPTPVETGCENVRVLLDGSNQPGPGETLRLRAMFGTYDLLASWIDWSLDTKPDMSLAELQTTGGSDGEVELKPDFLGEYRVRLDMSDQNGKKYGPCIQPVYSTLDGLLVVELAWTTPGAEEGADLDLHVSSQAGQWGAHPFDCFWDNPQAAWGDASTLDDGFLLSDARYPSGPEHFRLSEKPSDTSELEIGVRVNTSRGAGASPARITLYYQGRLLETFRHGGLVDGDFWWVTRLDLRDGGLEIIDKVSTGYPE